MEEVALVEEDLEEEGGVVGNCMHSLYEITCVMLEAFLPSHCHGIFRCDNSDIYCICP